MIKAVIVDCFGVLTSDTWKEFVESLPEDQREPAHQLNHAYDRGHISKSEFLDAVQDLTGRQPSYVDEKLDNETTKNTDLLAYIAELRQRGYKIGLLSNIATNWIRDHFLTDAEQALFDEFVFSYEVGLTKPDPRIFQLMAERLGAEPAACIMIDDIDSYCAAAREQGMQAVQYQSFEQLKAELEPLLNPKS
jgi:putative hydrolase of the HAD superfamily